MGLVREPGIDGEHEVRPALPDEVDDLVAQSDAVEAGCVGPVELDEAADSDNGARLSLLRYELPPRDVVGQRGVEHSGEIIGDRYVRDVGAGAGEERDEAAAADVGVVVVGLHREDRSGVDEVHRADGTGRGARWVA
ncbi:MAG: hypothetical protein M5T61_15080 [Acidimicrobiia bacterium]|nr:hypothetical protein [Acidimicrobiia bacterium]